MVIVAGYLNVDPDLRASYLADCVEVVAQARSAPGCLDFTLAADLLDPGRVVVYERWENQAAVEVFRGDGPSGEQSAVIRSASIVEYDIADVRALT